MTVLIFFLIVCVVFWLDWKAYQNRRERAEMEHYRNKAKVYERAFDLACAQNSNLQSLEILKKAEGGDLNDG